VAGITIADGPIRAEAGPQQVISVVATLRAPEGAVSGRQDVVFTITSLDDPDIATRHESRFFGPLR
jgi:hypothetical protein